MVCACPNPNCTQMFKIDDSFAGKQATCPKCKKPFIIPKAPLETVNKQGATKTIPTAVQVTTPNSAIQPPPAQSSPASQTARHAPPIPPNVQAQGAGLKKAPVPPPLPISTTAQKAPGPKGPPPLPPGTGPQKQGAVKPPEIPRTVGAASGAAINLVISSLVRALSTRKLVFGFLVCIFLLLFWLGPSIILIGLAEASGSRALSTICCILSITLYIGIVGTFSGGIAYMGHMEQQRHIVGIGKALGFCGRKFISLFFGSVLFVIVILLVSLLTNGFVVLLNRSITVGSLLAAVLFIPQFILNFALVLAFGVGVLVPCSVAVENIGALDAISRLVTCVRRDTGQLMIHFTATILFSAVVMTVICVLLFLAMTPTAVTNGPPAIRSTIGVFIPFLGTGGGGMSTSLERFEREFSRMGSFGESRPTSSPWGGRSRWFFMILVLVLPCIYAGVYWILSFTAYYEAAKSRFSNITGSFMRAGP